MKKSNLRDLGLAWGFSPTNKANKMTGALAPGVRIEAAKCFFEQAPKAVILAQPESLYLVLLLSLRLQLASLLDAPMETEQQPIRRLDPPG